MNDSQFIDAVKKLNINITDIQINKLNKYYELLIDYNSHTNVTSIRDKENIYLKHFYDSLTLTKVINLNETNNILDIGSGAGFPGLVLAIFYPNIEITVLDSNNKKTTFMQIIVDELNLNNCKVINARAEEYASKHISEYDVVVSRAVAFIDIIVELSMPFVKQNGKIILMKGNLQDELSILKKHKDDLNIKNYEIIRVNLCSNQERNFVIITKNKLISKIMNYSQIKKRNEKWTS